MQLHIELRCLSESRLYAAYLRYLRAYVEVYEPQAVAHVLLVEHLQRFEQLSAGESELRCVAAALLPLARARGGQLDANAYVGPHIQLLGHTGYDLQLVHLLHHNEYVLAHLLRQEGQLYVALVLVSVAHDNAVALALHGYDGV